MLRLPHHSGPILQTCFAAGFCAILFTGTGSSMVHAPTSTYSAEKILCIGNPIVPRVQFSKGKVDFRHSGAHVSAPPPSLEHGDIIYTGIDGFVSIQISATERVNVNPQTQVRIERSGNCSDASPPAHEQLELLTAAIDLAPASR